MYNLKHESEDIFPYCQFQPTVRENMLGGVGEVIRFLTLLIKVTF